VEGTITYGRDTIHYEVRFLRTRQTLGIEVHPDSRVLVRAPIGCPEALIRSECRNVPPGSAGNWPSSSVTAPALRRASTSTVNRIFTWAGNIG
jgi:hypothetical protein